jgi:hypothetical protein
MTRYLTKSRFKLAVECPAKLYYAGKDNLYRNLKQEDTFLQALADGGFQVGAMATLLYPQGIEITATSNAEAEQQTEALLQAHDQVVLFEPAIRYQNLFIRIDILVKQGHHFELIEVKAKSYNSLEPNIAGVRVPIKSDMLPYIQDVAFQRYVLTQYLNEKKIPAATVASYLVMPDKAVAASVDGLNQLFKVSRQGKRAKVLVAPMAAATVGRQPELLCKVPVDSYVDIVMRQGIAVAGTNQVLPLAQAAKQWALAYESDTRIEPNLHKGCSSCEFRERTGGDKQSGFHECLSHVMKLTPAQIDAGTVLDIWHFRRKDELLAQNVYRYDQVNEEDIKVKNDKEGLSRSQRQWMQLSGIPKDQAHHGFYLDRDLMANRMAQWRYPLHMIDFETATVALPFFKGMRPYENIAFQYSHHVIEEDGSVRHAGEFILAEPGVFPNFEFVRALKKELENDSGTIFRWASHENTVLTHIARQIEQQQPPLPDTKELLAFITQVTTGGERDMVDLAVLAERAYFHPDTKARTSIKKVLPAVLVTSAYLRKKYQASIYGVQIPSRNYAGFSWWEERKGRLIDPYERLKELTQQMLGEEGADAADLEALDVDIVIAEGGAAAMAFARLQFEDLSPETREAIKAALLRYCELDTFAMVMIVEAWRDWTQTAS